MDNPINAKQNQCSMSKNPLFFENQMIILYMKSWIGNGRKTRQEDSTKFPRNHEAHVLSCLDVWNISRRPKNSLEVLMQTIRSSLTIDPCPHSHGGEQYNDDVYINNKRCGFVCFDIYIWPRCKRQIKVKRTTCFQSVTLLVNKTNTNRFSGPYR